MLPTPEGLNQDSELEETKVFFSHIFLLIVRFGCFLLPTILERLTASKVNFQRMYK